MNPQYEHRELAQEAELEELREEVTNLRRALDSRVVLEQAKGVLAERYGVSVEEAFALLRYATRTARMQIHALARDVVEQRESPAPIRIALARTTRWRAAAQRERAEAIREDATRQRRRAMREAGDPEPPPKPRG